MSSEHTSNSNTGLWTQVRDVEKNWSGSMDSLFSIWGINPAWLAYMSGLEFPAPMDFPGELLNVKGDMREKARAGQLTLNRDSSLLMKLMDQLIDEKIVENKTAEGARYLTLNDCAWWRLSPWAYIWTAEAYSRNIWSRTHPNDMKIRSLMLASRDILSVVSCDYRGGLSFENIVDIVYAARMLVVSSEKILSGELLC